MADVLFHKWLQEHGNHAQSARQNAFDTHTTSLICICMSQCGRKSDNADILDPACDLASTGAQESSPAADEEHAASGPSSPSVSFRPPTVGPDFFLVDCQLFMVNKELYFELSIFAVFFWQIETRF